MKRQKKSLLQQLKQTILGLGFAMIALWFLFYFYMNFAIKSYTMHNMEQVSGSIITKLEQTFLELEDISFAVSQNEGVRDFLTTEDRMQVHTKSAQIMKELNKVVNQDILAENLILYNHQGEYYRFYGNISNTAAERIYYTIQKETIKKQMQITVEDVNYIGYVNSVYYKNTELGKIVLLIEENEIYRLFQEAGGIEDMTIALAADNQIIVSNEEKVVGLDVEEFRQSTKYLVHKEVGFTPFELFVVYGNTNKAVTYFFLGAIIITASLLWFIFTLFLRFWKNNFFEPIQGIIKEVEKFDGGKGEKLEGRRIEYFDGLVTGINNMIVRMEQKEAELFQAVFSLQQAEIKKQKAFIVSLKKQINAHFTVNVLNNIKALSHDGENDKVGLMCDGLSYLLRYANGGENMVNAMEEFFVLSKYLDIMEIRYPGRFIAEVDMEDFLETIKLPRMLMQPLVENSILHGFTDNTTKDAKGVPGNIHIYCKVLACKIAFIVEDNGCGIEAGQMRQIQRDIENIATEDEIEVEGLSHVALFNIHRRIRSYFGNEYGVKITSKEGEGTRVVLTIPKM
ncbi:MAG: sensor histidine kinase [Velocimicrobium sp.]